MSIGQRRAVRRWLALALAPSGLSDLPGFGNLGIFAVMWITARVALVTGMRGRISDSDRRRLTARFSGEKKQHKAMAAAHAEAAEEQAAAWREDESPEPPESIAPADHVHWHSITRSLRAAGTFHGCHSLAIEAMVSDLSTITELSEVIAKEGRTIAGKAGRPSTPHPALASLHRVQSRFTKALDRAGIGPNERRELILRPAVVEPEPAPDVWDELELSPVRLRQEVVERCARGEPNEAARKLLTAATVGRS